MLAVDTLHPGRFWATKLTSRPESIEELKIQVFHYLQKQNLPQLQEVEAREGQGWIGQQASSPQLSLGFKENLPAKTGLRPEGNNALNKGEHKGQLQ